jgi:putative ABC transport system ATP-binding protein
MTEIASPTTTLFNPKLGRLLRGESSPSLEVNNLQHYYGTGELRKQVLFDNTLTVHPGEIIIMTGPSGSGKTTLLTLIGTLRRVQEGQLHVLGTPLHSASDRELNQFRRQVGFIFQAHNLFESLTATQNVKMSLELVCPELSARQMIARSKEILEQVGLGDRTNHKPKQLSGGQKQRVAIARGLVHQPKLVLADEPTAALDEQSGRTVVEMLQKMAKENDTTIIIVTHDNRILDVADRIVNLIDGRITSDVLVQEAAIISQLLAQCKVFEGVTPRTLVSVADQMQPETFPARTQVITEGDIGDKFYLIREGRVSVRQGSGETQIATLGEGDFFGEMALLTGQPRNASIVTLEETTLYTLSKANFQAAMSERASWDAEIRSSLFDR